MASSSLEGNKILSAVLLAGIVGVGSGVLSGILYAPHQLAEPAYKIALPEGGGEGTAAEAAPAAEAEPIGVLLASADVAAGEGVAKKCTACHSFDAGGANKVGPALHNIVGREIGKHEGFSYSDAMAGKGGAWDYEALNGFLIKPQEWLPGTKMSFAGLAKAKERADVIAYLRSVTENPPPLPEAEAPAAEPAAAEAPAEAPAEGQQAAPAEPAAPAEQATASQPAPATEQPAEQPAPAPAEQAAAEPAPAEPAPAPAEPAPAEQAAAAPAQNPAPPVEAAPAAPAAPAEQAAADAPAPAAEPAPPAEPAPAQQGQQVALAAPAAPAAPAPAAPAAAGGGFATQVAAADAEAGRNVAKKCLACHSFDPAGANKVGPGLHGVVGREIGKHEGFSYSKAMAGKGGAWDYDTLNAYLTNPKQWLPGNKMAFPGLPKEKDRADVIAYLRSISENAPPLPGT